MGTKVVRRKMQGLTPSVPSVLADKTQGLNPS